MDGLNFPSIPGIHSRLCIENENLGWAAGDDGIILKTSDGGYNWSNQNSGKTL
ncbi:MAG: hypothetical protein MZV64_01870 [Ignavibacteriales bacterium]|nr:hypothetical protein [Ignavibacteriales bacterium]